MSFFTKAVVAGLKKYPYVNAEIQGNELLLKKYYDIGIAVSTEEGLVVPVVRDCDRKSFAEIEADIAAFAQKARDNKLALSDLQGEPLRLQTAASSARCSRHRLSTGHRLVSSACTPYKNARLQSMETELRSAR